MQQTKQIKLTKKSKKILEALAQHNSPMTISHIAKAIGSPYGIHPICNKFVREGLTKQQLASCVFSDSTGYCYTITDKGKYAAYLVDQGEL